MEFYERLSRAIGLSGLTNVEIAKRLGVQPPRITDWAKGNITPGADTVCELTRVLGVNGHWLLTGEGDPAARPEDAQLFVGKVRELLAAIPLATAPEVPAEALDAHHRTLLPTAPLENLDPESSQPAPPSRPQKRPKGKATG